MKLKKVISAAALLFMLMTIPYVSAAAQSNSESKLLSLRIDNLELEAQNIHMLLSRFSEKTGIPVGLEVSTTDDLSISKSFKLQIERGTLADVLNAIVMQDPVYKWRIREGVVNILPQESYRDPLLKELVNADLEKFSIKRGLGKFGFRLNLSTATAVKTVLDRYRVVQDNQSFMSRDFTSLGHNYELEVTHISVLDLLNRVIRESQTKYWIMQRYGEHRQFFVVNL